MPPVEPADLVGRVRVTERSYLPASAPEHNRNDTADFLFVLPASTGRLRLRDDRGRVLHDGLVAPGMVRIVVPGEQSDMRADAGFESLVLAVPGDVCADVAAPARWSRRAVVRPDAPLHRLAPWLRDAARTDDGAARDLVLGGLAIAVLGAVVGTSETPQATGFTDTQLRRVIDFAEDRVNTDLNLVEWAAEVGLPAVLFARMFSRHFGVSPYTWYLDRRVQLAMEYLRDTELTLSDVALRTGFSSQSHFTGAFRRRVGMPPGRWRSRQRGAR